MTKNEYVVHLQEKLGMTKTEFANHIDMPPSNYINIANGVYKLGEKRFKQILGKCGADLKTFATHENKKHNIDE